MSTHLDAAQCHGNALSRSLAFAAENVFTAVNSYVLSSGEFLRLGRGISLWSAIKSATRVDCLPGYTLAMFATLTDFLWCECRVRLPGTKRVVGRLNLEWIDAEVHCFTRHDLAVLRTAFAKSWISARSPPTRTTRGDFFSYLLAVDRHEELECNGIAYLRRQCEHIHDDDHYLIIVAADRNPANHEDHGA